MSPHSFISISTTAVRGSTSILLVAHPLFPPIWLSAVYLAQITFTELHNLEHVT